MSFTDINIKSFQCDLCFFLKHKVKKNLSIRLGIENTKFNIVKCLNCGLLSLYPLPNEIEFSQIYDDYAVKKDRISVENIRLKIYADKLKKLKKYCSGKKLLDIGAGVGTFVNSSKEYGFDAYGVEYEKQQCKISRELYHIDLINGKLEDVYNDLLKIRFGVINIHHVLEHVQSPKRILGMSYNLLNRNGILLIEVPNQFNNIKKEFMYYWSNKLYYPDNRLHHLYFFSINTLTQYIKLNKFKLIELNQFRPRDKKVSFPDKIIKDSYRYLVSKLNIGGSSIIEVYLRK